MRVKRELKGIFVTLYLFCIQSYTYACEPQVALGDVISFCQGNSITLNASNPNSTYYWSTGATTPTLTVTTSGLYWVVVNNSCGTTTDSVEIIVDAPIQLNLGPDRILCRSNGAYVIKPPYSSSYEYEWQDQSSDSVYVATQSGTYRVEITNACGIYSDEITIDFQDPPVVDIGPDQTVCNNTPVVLTVGNTPFDVNWSNGDTGKSVTITESGTYWARINNSCGAFYDTVNVKFTDGPNIDLGGEVGLCIGGAITLDSRAYNGTYLWNTGATTRSISVTQTGTYWVRFTDACGTFSDTVRVVATGPADTDLGPDTVMCEGNILTLDAKFPGSTYSWDDGSTEQTREVFLEGTYWVGIDNGCGFEYDTIEVKLKPFPSPIIAGTQAICRGTTRTLDAGYWGPETSYLWSDNLTGRFNQFSVEGDYWVVVSNSCGADTTFFSVVFDDPANVSLGRDEIVCDDAYALSIFPSPTDTILWSTGDSTSHTINITNSGTYWVEVRNACGVFTDTVKLTFLKPPRGIASDNSTFCRGDSAILSMPVLPMTSYLWSTGDTSHTIVVYESGKYWVEVTNVCGVVTDTIDIEVVDPINLDLGPDDELCEPAVKILDVTGLGADKIRWSTGSRNGVLPVTRSGTYWVRVTNICGTVTDTINVTINQLPDPKLNDTAFCLGSNMILDVSQTTDCTFLWNTGETTPSISVDSPGWFFVDITNQCGTIRDSIYVKRDEYLPPVNLGNDTIFCEGTLLLDPGYYDGATYKWQNGSSKQTFNVTKSGTYYVEIRNACNVVYDTVDVLITGPPKLTLGTTVRFCYRNILTLNAKNPGSTYLWSTGETTQTINVDSGGVYWCIITNPCGTLTDTVEAIVEYFLDDLDLGPDTVICEGEMLVLYSGHPEARNRWQDGSRESSFTVTETGMYSVTLENTCGMWMDSIFVEVQNIPFFDIPDTVICAIDGSLSLTGPPDMESYVWSTGDTAREVNLSEPGSYGLTVSNKCFSYTDSIFVTGEYPLNVDLGPDTAVCMTESYFLDPGIDDYTVYWDDGGNWNVREVTRSGIYWAMARNSCGVFSDTVTVRFDYILDPPITDTVVCIGDTAVFDLTQMPYEFEWFDGSKDPLRGFAEDGIYPMTISNKCGAYNKEFSVRTFRCDCPLYVPDAFSPNGDDVNDVFRVMHNCIIKDYKIEIFTRWGERVFTSTDDTQPWDGVHKGKVLQQGVYIYKIQYIWDVYGVSSNNTLNGTITLLP